MKYVETKNVIRAERTFAIFQDRYGERHELPVDYLATVSVDGREQVACFKLVNLCDMDGFINYVVKDHTGRVIPFSEIVEKYGDE